MFPIELAKEGAAARNRSSHLSVSPGCADCGSIIEWFGFIECDGLGFSSIGFSERACAILV